ncbi:hypothetical protein K504DRAFT_456511 [Pleomassaria siparia CBS 279.74]|uniref:Uncharacterized protein n=1 Tax=Pleomassaria siparia CBS 279.74 TaxID=1314801 RepID=A0A6G1K820_9PLEO|nr:hypothetical protein K504DRAFT_456511 [Pleomassaria siparia CBS 279.74]
MATAAGNSGSANERGLWTETLYSALSVERSSNYFNGRNVGWTQATTYSGDLVEVMLCNGARGTSSLRRRILAHARQLGTQNNGTAPSQENEDTPSRRARYNKPHGPIIRPIPSEASAAIEQSEEQRALNLEQEYWTTARSSTIRADHGDVPFKIRPIAYSNFSSAHQARSDDFDPKVVALRSEEQKQAETAKREERQRTALKSKLEHIREDSKQVAERSSLDLSRKDESDLRQPNNRQRDYSNNNKLQQICAAKIATILPAELTDAPLEVKRHGARLICSYNRDDKDNLYIPERHLTMNSVLLRPSMWSHLWYSFEAMEAMQPDFDFSTIDLVCTMKVLTSLLEFSHGVSVGYGFTTRLVEQTLFIDRFEGRSSPWLSSTSEPEYPKEFIAAATTPEDGIPGGAKHYRWIQYKFGDLTCLVLVEVDAWTPKDGKSLVPEATIPPSEPYASKYVPDGSVFKVGLDVPQDLLIDLKAWRKSFGLTIKLPVWYFGRIETFITGFYKEYRGRASRTKGCTTKDAVHRLKVDRAQTKHGSWKMILALPKVVTLLHRLRDVTKQSERLTTVAVTSSRHPGLHTYEPEFDTRLLQRRNVAFQHRISPDFLPTDVIKRFWRGGGEKAVSDEAKENDKGATSSVEEKNDTPTETD